MSSPRLFSYKELKKSSWACFSSSVSGSNWNLVVLVFVEGGKPENAKKSHGTRTRANNKLNKGHFDDREESVLTASPYKRSHWPPLTNHCAIPAPPIKTNYFDTQYINYIRHSFCPWLTLCVLRDTLVNTDSLDKGDLALNSRCSEVFSAVDQYSTFNDYSISPRWIHSSY